MKMIFLLRGEKPMGGFFILLFFLFSCTHASPQVHIPPIAGWKQELFNGVTRLTPKALNSGISYEIFPLQKIKKEEGNMAEWLKLTAIKNLATSGYPASSIMDQQTVEENGYYFYAVVVKPSGGKPMIFSFMSYQRPDGQIRLARFTQPGDIKTPLLDTAVNHFISLSKTDGKMNRNDVVSSKNNTNGQGKSDLLKPEDIKGVVIHEEYGYGVGGILILEYKPYLLLKDGSILKDLAISPYDLEVKTSKQKQADKWGTWKLQDKTLIVQMPEKGGMKTHEWKDKRWYWTNPAAKGEVINGSFIAMSGGGNTAAGGTSWTAVSKNIRFNNIGQFTQETSAGVVSEGSATGYSQSDKGGTYKLNGYSIELYYNNGKTVKTLFYFFPDGKDNFGMAGRTYSKD